MWEETDHVKLNTPCNHWTSLLIQTPNRKGLGTNDTSLLIITNVFMTARLFQLLPCTIYLNTQISEAAMTTAFESIHWGHIWSFLHTIESAAKTMNHVFPHFGNQIYSRLTLLYSPKLLPPWPPFLLFCWNICRKKCLRSRDEKILKADQSYSPWPQLKTQF